MRFYIGLDAHTTTSTLCVLDEHGRHVETFTVRGRFPAVAQRLRGLRTRLGGELVVCYEASLSYGVLHDLLTPFCHVVVAHPGRLRLIFQGKRKNDRVDAKKLATLLLLDQVPRVHVPSIDVRAWREVVEFRRSTIDKRTRCKNGIKAVLRKLSIAVPFRSLWTKKGMAWLKELALPTPQATLKRDVLLDELEHLGRQVGRVTKELDRLALLHPAVTLLMTIPGIGPRTAEAFVAYVDDAQRFGKTRRIGAYLGLVPSQDASAAVNRLGHITKEGPATLRKLLVEASWRAVDKDASMRGLFERVAAGNKDRRKVALVAVAHKLSRVMLAMMKSGVCYEPTLPPPEEAAKRAA